jgi:hypothetical protein
VIPDVSGRWSGTWRALDPSAAAIALDEAPRLRMDAEVHQRDGTWTARFEADCGRPYKYLVTMEGRVAQDVVLFRGTADLGAEDGGVFEWIGRATDRAFIGFYVNAGYTGAFALSRSL